jgi:type II restriction enzyme
MALSEEGIKNMKKNFNEFIATLNEDLFTWHYFVDFRKVRENAFAVKTQLSILEALLGENDLHVKYIALLKRYPEIRSVLPILIATRVKKLKELKILNTETLKASYQWGIFDPSVELTKEIEVELLHFFQASGLGQIFENKEISNLKDYVFGVEAGMDTNTRKNRSGDLMEDLVDQILAEFTEQNNDFKYEPQATVKKIKKLFDYEVKTNVSDRSYDFALFNTLDSKLYLIEVNLYGSGGTKLKAVAGEFEKLNNFVLGQNIEFIWVTDGIGWRSAENPMLEAFNNNKYTFNIKQFKKFLTSIST